MHYPSISRKVWGPCTDNWASAFTDNITCLLKLHAKRHKTLAKGDGPHGEKRTSKKEDRNRSTLRLHKLLRSWRLAPLLDPHTLTEVSSRFCKRKIFDSECNWFECKNRVLTDLWKKKRNEFGRLYLFLPVEKMSSPASSSLIRFHAPCFLSHLCWSSQWS